MARFPVAPQAFNESNQPKGTGGGGGGSSTLAGLTDVVLASPADTQVLTYVSASSKWQNKPAASGGGGGPTVVYDTPEAHGAARDGVTNDTPAINAAIASAVSAAQAAGTFYCEVWFTPGKYLVSSACSHAQSGNAQVMLPYINTSEAVTLRLRGVRAESSFYYSGSQQPGAIIASTLTGQTWDAVNGPPAIIGSATPEKLGVGNFSRMCLVVDGLTVEGPADPTLHGIDIRGLTNAHVVSLSVQAPVTGLTNAGGGSFSAGLAMPVNNNSNNAEVDTYTCVGWYCGFTWGEHTNARRIRVIECRVGAGVSTPSGYTYSHSARIEYLTTEQCRSHLYCDPILSAGQKCSLDIGLWDLEDNNSAGFATFYHLYDASNMLYGTANVWRDDATSFGGPPLTIGAGGVNFSARYLKQSPGHVAAPSLPGSTTALVNPFFRDAAVTVTGGTVTAIAVDGTATGLTAGTVIVPTGKAITLTYSVAPAWNWVLL